MLKLFNLFVNKDDYRTWMTKPFHVGKYDAATDAYVLVGIEQDEGYDSVKATDGNAAIETTVLMYLDQESNQSVKITVEELKKAVEFGTKEAMLVIDGKCDECSGEGEVEYTYEYEYSTYETNGECPKCKGTGIVEEDSDTPSGMLTSDMTKCINIGVCYYHGHILNTLLQAAILLQEDHVALVAQSESTKGTKFLVGKAIVVLMPIRYNGDAEVYYLGGTQC